ncbi:helix-turn-helix domain-containing protein [Alkalihalobacillus deserti]|uniref:helix-turn-helix domain-containing protein n=1 Tax=Alkalihalobacillus deserti TaxID=2879466 RepID=UPI001D14F9C6|nr:helix-turn-helix transcriptional regulator [Alkalihalobacillus deserti]
MNRRDNIEKEIEQERKVLQEEIDKEVGKIVRALRKQNNFSRVDLAYKVGISLAHMGKIERGEVTMSHQISLYFSSLFGSAYDRALANPKSEIEDFLRKHEFYDKG